MLVNRTEGCLGQTKHKRAGRTGNSAGKELQFTDSRDSKHCSIKVKHPTRREAEVVVFRTLLQASTCKYELIGKMRANVFTNESMGEGL